ncbi:hypothetical protein DLAC_04718 [Tieghemostelium lacteum]|uniref:PWWP domain-containing protein n=1 Tax=Tieghemostelium lacteum TaxID=361077 RepID=A0A151ZKA4_TIELA|nr:hypothetical protein DLAC_04718 [Tieghemostelium lacteum]|eukprot:KYQ94422.1 hypothetical protein DLAC_04718 [Tieghemostelium lacteum]
MSKKFEEGTVFSGTYGHWGTWPVRIARHSEVGPQTLKSMKPDSYLVYFFGSNDYALIKEPQLKEFVPADLLKQKFKVRDMKKLQVSIDRANEWIKSDQKIYPIFIPPPIKTKKEPVDDIVIVSAKKTKKSNSTSSLSSSNGKDKEIKIPTIMTRKSTSNVLKTLSSSSGSSGSGSSIVKPEPMSQQDNVQVPPTLVTSTSSNIIKLTSNSTNNKENKENSCDVTLNSIDMGYAVNNMETQAITPIKRTPKKSVLTTPKPPHFNKKLVEFLSPIPNLNVYSAPSVKPTTPTIKKEKDIHMDSYIENHELNGLSKQSSLETTSTVMSKEDLENDLVHILAIYSTLTLVDIKNHYFGNTDTVILQGVLESIGTMNSSQQWILNTDRYQYVNDKFYKTEQERNTIRKKKIEIEMLQEMSTPQHNNQYISSIHNNTQKLLQHHSGSKRLLSPQKKNEKFTSSPMRKKLAFDNMSSPIATITTTTTTYINNNNNSSNTEDIDNTIPLPENDSDETEDDIEATQYLGESNNDNNNGITKNKDDSSQSSLISTPPTPQSSSSKDSNKEFSLTFPPTLVIPSPRFNKTNVQYNNNNTNNNIIVNSNANNDSMDLDFPPTLPVGAFLQQQHQQQQQQQFQLNNSGSNNNFIINRQSIPVQSNMIIDQQQNNQQKQQTSTTTSTTTLFLESAVKNYIKELVSEGYLQTLMTPQVNSSQIKAIIDKCEQQTSIQVNQMRNDILEELQSIRKLESIKTKNNLKSVINSLSEIEQSFSTLKKTLENLVEKI